jgi:cytochrome c5
MMREKWAIFIVLFTCIIVLLLAMLFAFIQNPEQPETLLQSEQQAIQSSAGQVPAGTNSIKIEQGRKIFQEQSCTMCHSIAGEGNPRNPLDKTGDRRTDEDLRNLITGADALQDLLPVSVRRIKQKYKALSDDELDALIRYLRK